MIAASTIRTTIPTPPAAAPRASDGSLIPLDDADAGTLAGQAWAMNATWEQLDDFRANYGALLAVAGRSAYRRAFCAATLAVLDSLESEACATLV